MDTFLTYYFMFLVYAFLGYICEVFYVFLLTKKMTNRGYLYGPLVPIYAFGALLIILPFRFIPNAEVVSSRWYLVAIIGFLGTSMLEYFTSFFMEKIFHMRWWDYSERFCNINGRVCLRNSTLFMLLVLAVVYGIDPLLDKGISYVVKLPVLAYLLFGFSAALLMVDFILSTKRHIDIAKIITKLDELQKKAQEELSLARERAYDKLESVKGAANEKLTTVKENASEKLLSFTEEMKDRINKMNIHYPTMKLISGKKRISPKEYIENIKNKLKKTEEEE